MMSLGKRVLHVLWSAILAESIAFGQGTGTIHGAVTDPTGLPVAGAKLTATLGERGLSRAVVTDSQGDYVVPLLPVGTYTVRVEVQGFKVFSQGGVGLTTNANARLDARLEIGSSADVVFVTAEAPLVDSR